MKLYVLLDLDGAEAYYHYGGNKNFVLVGVYKNKKEAIQRKYELVEQGHSDYEFEIFEYDL